MLGRFIRNENAATAIEYGLIAAIISLAVLASAGGISDTLNDSYQNTATKLQEAR